MRIFIMCGIRKWMINALVAFVLINLCLFPTAHATDPAIPALSFGASLKVISVSPQQAMMGDKITVEVDGLSEAIKQGKEKFDPTKLILYFDGYPLEEIYPDSIDPAHNRLIFTPVRNDANEKKWISLLGSPKNFLRPTKVSVGFSNQHAIAVDASKQNFQFIVFQKNWFFGYMIALLITIILFLWLARDTDIIRDSNPPLPDKDKRKPYSLAKLQASVWFFLVVASFLFIWLVTGDNTNTLTGQALILMGIGTGTALGAAMIDDSKRETVGSELDKLHPEKSKLKAEVKELAAKITKFQTMIEDNPPGTAQDTEELSKSNIELAQKETQLDEIRKKIINVRSALSKPVSEGLTKDLLTDVNGVSFHRFQMLVWTIVLGFIFCVEVYKTLRMPEFDTTLLALMGISAGTYLGFKIPERTS